MIPDVPCYDRRAMTESTFLRRRNALVMGAGNEAAAAVALALATAGADVALTTATPAGEEAFGLRSLSRQIDALGRRSVVESVDMNIGTNVQVAVRQVAKQLGSIDILVAAPGIKPERESDRLGDADWTRLLGYNLSAVFYACRSVAREMTNRPGNVDRGRIIVLLPSLDGETSAAYIAAREGAAALVQALSIEWADKPLSLDSVLVGKSEEAAANTAKAVMRLLQES